MTKAQTRIAAEAHWWINHESLMDYEQIRPVPVEKIKAHEACKTDCSGLVYGIWWALGFPDPTGGDYTAHDIVYTGTLLTANDRVGQISQLVVGDLCIFGTTESTDHVAFVIEPGADPLLCSHGSKAGPAAIRLSVEREWHKQHGHPVLSLRRTALPSDAAKPGFHWAVFNGAGNRIGKTNHPAIWGTRHPKLFRKYRNVRFERRPN